MKMLRRNLDEMITKGPFSDVSNSFLFGFSTTIITFMTIIIIIAAFYNMFRQMNVIKRDNNEFITFIKHYLRQQKLILPLYYDLAFKKKLKGTEEDEDELTEKPTFVIPGLKVGLDESERCEITMSAASAASTPLKTPGSLTKRRTNASSNNLFGAAAAEYGFAVTAPNTSTSQ